MGQKDMAAKEFVGHNDTFADIFNGFLFSENGVSLVDAEERLVDAQTEGIVENIWGELEDMLCDFKKRYLDEGKAIQLAILSVENESKIGREISVRVMGYVYAEYRSQLRKYNETREILRAKLRYAKLKKNGKAISEARRKLRGMGRFRLIPMIVIVLNYGSKKADIPGSIKGLMDSGNPYVHFCSDFNVYILNLEGLDDEQRKKFTGDFRQFLDLYNRTDDMVDIKVKEVIHWDSFERMVKSFMGDERLKVKVPGGKERSMKVDLIIACMDRIKRVENEVEAAEAKVKEAEAKAEAKVEAEVQNTKVTFATWLLRKKFPLDEIREATSLDTDQLKALAKSIDVSPVTS